MTDNKFAHYQSTIINHLYSFTIKEARECVGEVQLRRIDYLIGKTDQDEQASRETF